MYNSELVARSSADIDNEFISVKFESDNTATVYFRDNLHIVELDIAHALVNATARYNARMMNVVYRDNLLTYISDVRSIMSVI